MKLKQRTMSDAIIWAIAIWWFTVLVVGALS